MWPKRVAALLAAFTNHSTIMADSAPAKNNPADFLKTVLGRPVVVKLNSGVDYRGASRPDRACRARRMAMCTRRQPLHPPSLTPVRSCCAVSQVCWRAWTGT